MPNTMRTLRKNNWGYFNKKILVRKTSKNPNKTILIYNLNKSRETLKIARLTSSI